MHSMSTVDSQVGLDAPRPERRDRRKTRKRIPGPRPVLPERVSKSDSPTCFPVHGHRDPAATLMLMQMIADSYEDSRRVWEANASRQRSEGDDPGMYGPVNDGQRKIEHYCMSTGFLSRPALPVPELPPSPIPADPKDVKKEVKNLSRWDRFLNRSKRSGQERRKRTKAIVPKKVLCFLQKYMKVGEKPQPVQSVPIPLPQIARPARAALPRIVPNCRPRIRRMESADTLACSVRPKSIRKSIIPYSPVTTKVYVAPELCVPGFKGVDYDDFRTLVWPKLRQKPEPEPASVVQQKEEPIVKREPTPFYISAIILFLLHALMFSFMAGIILAALWTALMTILGGVVTGVSLVLSLFLPCAEDEVDYGV
ncbi:hypothetical protein FPV67DRAFT_1782333 [Lyophyllum atratum]|nr:hypothetical protein FPV67DRAFT_1782333 [Lyophyllum atratum]